LALACTPEASSGTGGLDSALGILAVAKTEVLAFDWGVGILGVLAINSNEYIPHHYGDEMIQGVKRIVSSLGTIVNFNGNGRDLKEISKVLGLSSVTELHISGEHNDMLEIASDIRWPPDPRTGSILGPGLRATYRHYFGDKLVVPPSHLHIKYEGNQLEYVASNWSVLYDRGALEEMETWRAWAMSHESMPGSQHGCCAIKPRSAGYFSVGRL
jgi:hypothetical protein